MKFGRAPTTVTITRANLSLTEGNDQRNQARTDTEAFFSGRATNVVTGSDGRILDG